MQIVTMSLYGTLSMVLTGSVILAAFRVNWTSLWSASLWLGLALVALLTTALSGFIDLIGVVIVISFGVAAWLVSRDDNSTRQRWGKIMLGLFALVIGLRWLPGFHNPRLLDHQLLSLDSTVFLLHANFDKAWIGAILVAFLYSSQRKCANLVAPRDVLRTTALVGAITILVTLTLAWATHFVRLDAKFPPFLPLVLIIHLLCTVIPEEAFFRLLIQTPLSERFAGKRYGMYYTVLITALLFAMVHFAGGVHYMALAFIAGMGYAYVYAKTRRLSAAIAVHFALNLVHFVGFSYPRLAP